MDAPELINNISDKILVIKFKNDINNLVVPQEILNTVLLNIVLKKVQIYLQDQNNFVNINRYLRKAFEDNEPVIKNMWELIQGSLHNFRNLIKNPTDFSYKFFMYFCNKVLKDSGETILDISAYQTMALLRAFITYEKALIQKNNQKAADLKDFSLKLKKPPYIFSMTDLFEIKDSAGIPYSKKYSPEFITSFISKATTRKNDEDLPLVVKILTEVKKEYYIDKKIVSRVFLRTLTDDSKEIRRGYFKKWRLFLKEFKVVKEMQNDAVFVESLDTTIKSDYKLLDALLNPSLIYLANTLPDMDENIKIFVDICFAEPGKFKSLDILLNIDRKELLKEVKTTLPLHYNIPFLGKIIDFFISLFDKKNKRKKTIGSQISKNALQEVASSIQKKNSQQFNSAQIDDNSQDIDSFSEDENLQQSNPAKPSHLQDLLDSINILKESYLSPGKNMDQTLEELIEKWNYMSDKSLTKDINVLIKKFLQQRKHLLVRYRTLDENKISELSDGILDQASSFDIKNKNAFKRYVALFMLKLLGNIKNLSPSF
jgi:hypothetical protein